MNVMNETPQIAPRLSPAIPGFATTVPLSSGPPRTTTATQEMLAVPQGTVIPGRPELKLTSSLFASIERTIDGIVISSVLFDEDGYGYSDEEAWRDFLSSLRDKLSSLEKREPKLAPADREILDLLRRSIALCVNVGDVE